MNNKKKAQAKLISVHIGHTAFLCLTASSLAGRDRKGQEGTRGRQRCLEQCHPLLLSPPVPSCPCPAGTALCTHPSVALLPSGRVGLSWIGLG